MQKGGYRSGIDQPPSRPGDFQAVFLGGFDPQADGGLSLANGIGPGLAVGHAARELRDFHHVGGILITPPDDYLVAVSIHNSFYASQASWPRPKTSFQRGRWYSQPFPPGLDRFDGPAQAPGQCWVGELAQQHIVLRRPTVET